ncbi:MAG: hypothetical protein IPH13_01815 [Planctomycetes bacterium]|nr:hypothetical protein [Planctomycetota bacterium]MCC7169298.1 hypothetical protein [Planctomycetota bacterium]
MRLLPAALIASVTLWNAEFGRAGDITPVRMGADAVEDALDGFRRTHHGKAAHDAAIELLHAIESAVPTFSPDGRNEAARVKALRALARTLMNGAPAATAKLKEKNLRKPGAPPAEPRVFPLPAHVRYRFGFRDVVGVDDADRALASALRAKKPLSVEDLPGAAIAEALAHGCVPELELLVASIERELDVDHGADEYALFLESWRNGGPHGDESFYEALDRSAGTQEAPFFYDAMLADFVVKFAAVEGKRWDLQIRHDKNQNMFLAYRQYRGFIEASAYALALPSDVKLPARLARYDYESAGQNLLSLRHQIDVLVELNDGDVGKVLTELKAFIAARPLPERLWNGYELAAQFSESFGERAKEFPATQKSSALDLATKQRTSWSAVAVAVRDATLARLAGDQPSDRNR